MRLTKEQTAKNRQQIIDTAARVFRERGIDQVTVADLMKEAGFTHGGFYNHFVSKEELIGEASRAAFDKAICGLTQLVTADKTGREFTKNLQAYLSPAHRDDCAGGCPAAAFVGEVSHQCPDMQTAYAKGIKAFIDIFQAHFPSKAGARSKASSREQAIELLSNLVGALTLARAVAKADPALSNELLAAGRRRLPK